MRKDWIIDVLGDLRAFAETNGLEATAAGLEDAMLVALAETSSIGRRRAMAMAEAVPAGPSRRGGNVTELFASRI